MPASAERPRLRVKVVPGAARDEVAGWLGAALKIRVSAAPEHGRANRAVEKLIATTLDLPKSAVAVVAGPTQARKTLAITGLDAAELKRRLDDAAPGGPRQSG